MNRLASFVLTGLVVAFLGLPADAQFIEDFESGSVGWTFDPVVGPVPGCQWAVDGTPATPNPLGLPGGYACGGTFNPLEATVAAGAAALNWNDGTAMQFGSTTATPFDNSATSPDITLTTVAGVTLNFDDYWDMDSCSNDVVPTTEGNHRRFIDIVDGTTGIVYDSLVLSYADGSVDVDTNWVSCNDGSGNSFCYHHTHSIALDDAVLLPGLSGATFPVTINVRFRVNINSYMGDIGAGSDVEDGVVGWFVDDLSVLCADAIAPTVPVLVLPADGTCSTSPILLDWSDSTDTTSCGAGAIANYDIDVATDSGFVTIVATGTFPPPSAVLFTAAPGTYFWRVRARDLSGNVSGYMITSSFVLEAPAAPALADTLFVNESSQGAQVGDSGFVDPVIDETPNFSAIYRDPNCSDFAAQLRFQVSSDPTFATLDFDSGVVPLTTLLPIGTRCPDQTIPTSLSRDTVYFWRIQFTDLGGLTGAFSLAQSFKIGDDFEFGVRPGSTNHSRKCWIATAAWGSPDSGQVLALQGWRTGVMENLGAGRLASRAYHQVGQDLAPVAAGSKATRTLLLPLAAAARLDSSMAGLLALLLVGLLGLRRMCLFR